MILIAIGALVFVLAFLAFLALFGLLISKAGEEPNLENGRDRELW